MADAHHHRASSGLKQKNKSHKSSSKRATKRAAGAGRVERLGPGKKAGNAAGARRSGSSARSSCASPSATSSPRTAGACTAAATRPERRRRAPRRSVRRRGGRASLRAAARVGHGDVAGALDAAARADVVVFVMCPTALDDDGAAEAMDDDDGRRARRPRASRNWRRAAFDEELEFPDEVDVAEDANARDRFARYRALPSFAASDWDVYDSLQRSYAKVHAARSTPRRRAFDAADAPGGAAVGAYVRVVLEVAPGAPPPGCARRASSYSTRTGSRWPCRPVFSTHALKGAKAKYERFLRRGDHFVCSVFGPLTFGPAPVFLRRATGEVVAAGAALDCDPNRVTLKRAVLTGLPARTHKRKAVVKQMFYNPRDVLYFKPAALTTKHGLTCHITEPIGTHGHFKVALSKPMKQNDTILLTLYKRVYPKLPGGDDDDAPLAIS
ncbi:U3 snoRNA binding protein [Aureococcus anophagefferens]|nr:U3 snoRNA binding protein [Aureococcus anophagefferens]